MRSSGGWPSSGWGGGMFSHELKTFGLSEEFPQFGMASNASYTGVKYGFDGAWTAAGLSAFAEEVLAGTREPTHQSEDLPEEAWEPGTPRKVVWRTLRTEVLESARPTLLEVYAAYKDRPSGALGHFAQALQDVAPDMLMLARYEGTLNHLPERLFGGAKDSMSKRSSWFVVEAGKPPARLKGRTPQQLLAAAGARLPALAPHVAAATARFEELEENARVEEAAKALAEEEELERLREAEKEDMDDLDDEGEL